MRARLAPALLVAAPARRDLRRLRRHGEAEAHAEPDRRADRRQGASRRRATARPRRRRSGSASDGPDRVDVEIVDGNGDVVRELARSRPQGRPPRPTSGTAATTTAGSSREGSYRPRVHLDRQRRTIVMYNRIRVDTTPPRIESFTARPLVISPDGDGRSDRAKIRYRVSERATVELYVDGIRALRRLGTQARPGRWTGSASPVASRSRRRRTRCAWSRATSRATSGRARARAPSSIRYLALGRDRVATTPGGAVRDPRALAGRGRFAGGSTDGSGRRAPGHAPAHARRSEPGRYVLEVERERPRQACRRRRAGAGAVTTAAQIAGVVGRRRARGAAPRDRRGSRDSRASSPGRVGSACLGALPAARPQPLPLVGGGAWAALVVSVAARGRAPALAVRARLRHARLHPAPAPGRHRRATRSNLLLPLYGVIGGLALVARAGQLAPRRRPRARARAGRAGRSPRSSLWTGLSLLWTRRRPARRDLPRRLPPPLRAARDRLRPAALARPLADVALGRARRDGARVRRGRRVPVGHPRRLLEPQRQGRSTRTRRSSASTPSSGTRRSTGATSTVAILASLAGILLGGVRGWRVAGLYAVVVRDLARPPHLVLAVELRRARGRHRRRGRRRLGPPRDAGARRARRS